MIQFQKSFYPMMQLSSIQTINHTTNPFYPANTEADQQSKAVRYADIAWQCQKIHRNSKLKMNFGEYIMETDFDWFYKFSISMLPPIQPFLLLLLLISIVSSAHPFATLIAAEENERTSAEVGNTYYLLPFRLYGTSQKFIQAPKTHQFLHVEVIVHWITNTSKLQFPNFDSSQKVRLTIEEETFGTVPKTPILVKQFLTQTGFKLQLQGGRRYRWKIESSGVIQKLVQIAMTNKVARTAVKPKGIHQQQVQFLREMSATLERAKEMRIDRENKLRESKLQDLWAWMSGLEMASLLGFLLVQLALFQKFMLPSSVV